MRGIIAVSYPVYVVYRIYGSTNVAIPEAKRGRVIFTKHSQENGMDGAWTKGKGGRNHIPADSSCFIDFEFASELFEIDDFYCFNSGIIIKILFFIFIQFCSLP